MPQLLKIPGALFQLFFWCFLFTACNNGSEKAVESERPEVDTTLIIVPDNIAPIKVSVDSAIKLPSVDSMPGLNPDISTISKESGATIAYKNKMRKGDQQTIQMNAQLDITLKELEANSRYELNEQKAKMIDRSDTFILRPFRIRGDKYLTAKIGEYDTAVFDIKKIHENEKQELQATQPSQWLWQVTAKKVIISSDIYVMITTEDSTGKQYEGLKKVLPIEIIVPEPYAAPNTNDSHQSIEEEPSFMNRYGWWLLSGAAVVILLLLWARLSKQKRIRELNSRVYFSYAWSDNTENTLIDKLYLSLQAAGFNVIRDKVNLKYRGLISGFMKDIGKGNIIIVSISDKYLKSRFCMYELYEVYRNCGMIKEAFVKKIFPIKEEEINLSDAAAVDHYTDYWKAEKLKLEAIVKDASQETSSEQFAQYEAVKRIESELGNLLYFLSDMNALNAQMLAENNFAEIKQSLAEAVKNLNDSL